MKTATSPRCRGGAASMARIFVSQPAMRLIEAAGGVD